MAKNRVPLQVSPKFAEKLKQLQKKIRMKTGNDRSLRELTDDFSSYDMFNEFEKKVLKKDKDIGLPIKLDRRFY